MAIPPETALAMADINSRMKRHRPSVLTGPGRLAYANAGPDTNGSQFFITEVPYTSLNGGYTIFGQCDKAAVDLVKKIARMPRGANDMPKEPVKITHIEIQNGGAAAK